MSYTDELLKKIADSVQSLTESQTVLLERLDEINETLRSIQNGSCSSQE